MEINLPIQNISKYKKSHPLDVEVSLSIQTCLNGTSDKSIKDFVYGKAKELIPFLSFPIQSFMKVEDRYLPSKDLFEALQNVDLERLSLSEMYILKEFYIPLISQQHKLQHYLEINKKYADYPPYLLQKRTENAVQYLDAYLIYHYSILPQDHIYITRNQVGIEEDFLLFFALYLSSRYHDDLEDKLCYHFTYTFNCDLNKFKREFRLLQHDYCEQLPILCKYKIEDINDIICEMDKEGYKINREGALTKGKTEHDKMVIDEEDKLENEIGFKALPFNFFYEYIKFDKACVELFQKAYFIEKKLELEYHDERRSTSRMVHRVIYTRDFDLSWKKRLQIFLLKLNDSSYLDKLRRYDCWERFDEIDLEGIKKKVSDKITKLNTKK